MRIERARARRVRAASARLGLLSLPLLILAVATGLWLYTVALRDDRPSSFAIWLHVVVERAGLAIVTAKVLESGRARLRARPRSRALPHRRPLADPRGARRAAAR